MSLISIRPCQQCGPKLMWVMALARNADELASSAADVFVDCRKCMRQVPRGMRPKRRVKR